MDLFAVQKSVRDNAEDLASYMRDLKNWEADIKKRDAELRGVNPEDEKLYPDIRSKQKKDHENKITDAGKSQKKKKISAFDYESWDKLDVESVIEEIESNEEEKMKEAAMYEKEKGNTHVKAGNWDKAISCYSKAIKVYPKDAVFFANRALCYLKLKDFQKAESDCTKAISLDSSYTKAWLRRSAAWEGLGMLKNSVRDLDRVLSLEPHNKDAMSKLATLKKKSKELESMQNEEKAAGDGIGSIEKDSRDKACESQEKNINGSPVESCNDQFDGDIPWKDYKGEIIKPINKPPHKRSKKPLRRVHIEEVYGNESLGGGEAMPRAEAAVKSSESSSPTISDPASGLENVVTGEPAPSELPPPPKSSVQFLMSWKRIKSFPAMALMYLKQTPPKSLPAVFGDSLEISILEEILNTLGQNVGNPSHCDEPVSSDHHSTYEFLKYLANVPRFSTLAMFLNSGEQVVSRQLLAHCVEIGECTADEAADLAGKFML